MTTAASASNLKAILKYASKGTLGALVLGYFGIIKPLQFYSRLIVYILAVAFCALYGATVSIFFTLIGKQGLSQWATARMFYTICRVLFGIKVVIKNPEALKTRPAVFLSNHQSELDVLILGATFPQYCSVTAKKSLKYYPFLGWFMALSGSVFIDRKKRGDALRAFADAAKRMNAKQQSVFMYPEGTRSYYETPGLLPFKKGAFHFAIQAGVPVVPYVSSNYSQFVNFKKRIFNSGTIEIEVLDPIETKNMTSDDVQGLYEEVESKMKKTVEKIGYGSEYEKKNE